MPGGNLTPVGWFSRRHKTREAHDAAVAAYKARSGRNARKTRADRRAGLN